jgi:hypothetical protein
MINSKYLPVYLVSLGLIAVVSSYSNVFKKYLDNDNEEYDLIKEYLLNESPLYGNNRPKLWIHTKYELNARKWKDFSSRNSKDLNQDYLHLTIKTIINHNGEDFNICLIDDDSFSKLLPNWDIDLSNVAEPVKDYFRNLAMTHLIYIYGGMVVPNSLVCLKSLKPLYDECVLAKKPFVCEIINRTTHLGIEKPAERFIPGIDFFGANKNDPVIHELMEYIKLLYKDGHISKENAFKGMLNQKCNEFIHFDKMNLIGGEIIGIKTTRGRPILLDEICEEAYIDLSKDAVGVFIPADEVLTRPKFQWFAYSNAEQILASNMIIAKYIKASITDTTNEYYNQNKQRCVVTI